MLAAGRAFTSYASVEPVLDAYSPYRPMRSAAGCPPSSETPAQAKWTAWTQRQDQAIRARLEQGDLDSMVNLLLLRDFVHQAAANPRREHHRGCPRPASCAPGWTIWLRVCAVRATTSVSFFFSGLLRSQGIDPGAPGADRRVRSTSNLRAGAQGAEDPGGSAPRKPSPASPLDRASLFADRGVSLDTSILPDFSIEQTLRDLKSVACCAKARCLAWP